jgi:peptidoglycan hydrolase-like protein with peptidoglycan-binding domain
MKLRGCTSKRMRVRNNPRLPFALAILLCALPLAGVARGDTPPGPAAAAPAAKAPARKLVSKSRKPLARRPRPKPVQMAPTPARISEIQTVLAKSGSYQGEPNGKWDAATIDAYSQFQSSHGLTPTGKLDALTLQKMGLGSEVAGRAAPLPLQTAPPPAARDAAPANP